MGYVEDDWSGHLPYSLWKPNDHRRHAFTRSRSSRLFCRNHAQGFSSRCPSGYARMTRSVHENKALNKGSGYESKLFLDLTAVITPQENCQ